jgi:hypothetical protein
MYAVTTTVKIVPSQFESARKHLESQVVPQVKSAPGVMKGYWTVRADHEQGSSMVIVDTKEHAEAGANMVRNGGTPPGVTLVDVEVREVVAQV